MKRAARGSLKIQDAKMTHLGTHTTLSGYIFATKAHIDNRKNMLNSNISSTCPRNMANFGPLAAEMVSLVWGTPANFNGFRVSVTARHSNSGRQPNFAALNRGRHLYSAGRPSRWALAHILVASCISASRVQHVSDLHLVNSH